MARDRFEVGVVVARRVLDSPWAGHAWLPCAALPNVPAAAPWTRLSAHAREETFYAGSSAVDLHAGDASHYRDNLLSGRPALWIALTATGEDRPQIATVTADPYEGEALAGLDHIVEAVEMPLETRLRVEAFVDAYYVERPFFKRERHRGEPDSPPLHGRRAAKPEAAE